METSREVYGRTLVEIARENPAVVALDADLSGSNRSALLKEVFPERFFEMGIAEQNMVAAAVGLSLVGKIPFVHSFVPFLVGRAYDQIRVGVAIGNANVKLIGMSCGLSDYGDGSTHQSVEDIALMRALPNMTVVVPADAVEMAKAAKFAAEHVGPVYIRVTRASDPVYFPEGDAFTLGKILEFRDGKDITIMACGSMAGVAVEAAKNLANEGISATVANVSTIKPLNVLAVRALARKTGRVLTVEEHSVIGGLGSAVCEALDGETGIVIKRVGIPDKFGQSASSHESLLAYYGLTAGHLSEYVRQML